MSDFLKSIFKFIVGTLLFGSGEYLGYKVFTCYNQASSIWILGSLSVIMTFIGMALILWTPFSFLNHLYYKIIDRNKTMANIVCIPIFILAILLFAVPAIVFYHYSGKYHKEQIEKFGIVQEILINNESHGKNSNNYSDFTFYYNGVKWRGSLRTWRYKLGDSAKIIYSKENPNEVEWYEKYLESKK